MRPAMKALRRGACVLIMCAAVLPTGGALGGWTFEGRQGRATDLDAFMGQVLERRDENWKKLQQYVLDERERFELTGPGRVPLWGDRREYTWFLRDGYFVRSPVTANGARVGEDDRRKYEDDFLRRARARDERAKADSTKTDAAPVAGDQPQASVEGLITQTRQPAFIDSAYFLRFKFEPGRYALVGREVLDGRTVLRIEYYPSRLFTHEQDDEERRRRESRRDRDEDVEASLERMMNKVALVTLWVLPDAHQIVKYTFDNVDLDFFPGAWLARVDEVRASMMMGQPFSGVWLPSTVDMQMSARMAVGVVGLRYQLEYVNYQEGKTGGRLVGVGAP